MELKEEKLLGKAPNYCKGQRQILGYFSCLSLPRSSGTREWIRPGLKGSQPPWPPLPLPLPRVSHPLAMGRSSNLPNDTCLWRETSPGEKGGAGRGGRMAPPPHQAPPAERKRAVPTPAAVSSRPLQSAARPQLAWCLHTPITASITVPEAATGRNRGGRGLGGPGWSSPAGPGLAETGPGSRGSRCSEPFPS